MSKQDNAFLEMPPFPYFGGKRKAADLIWQRFGRVENYVEPFFGSGAVLLRRPDVAGNETVNDADGYVANFWRSIQLSPDETARHADNPVNENDLHARHAWLLSRRDDLGPSLEGDPEYHDPKIAGWWAWGMSCWIGSGFCSGDGPWQIVNRQLVNLGNDGQGVNRKRVHLGNDGQGVNRKLVHLGNDGRGVNRKLVHLGNDGRGVNRQRVHLRGGQGVNRRLVHLGNDGRGVALSMWFGELAARLRDVRVCCGDWSRVCGPSVTFTHGLTGVFLDPPYADTANRESNLYRIDNESVAHGVREWAIEHGKRRDMRICLAGYDTEHTMPADWEAVSWDAGSGYGSQAAERTGNGKREVLWFSPACLGARQATLF